MAVQLPCPTARSGALASPPGTELRRRRHWPIPEQGRWLASVLQGHFNYYAVPGNIDSITAFRDQVRWHWMEALRRRSQRHRMTWDRYSRIERVCGYPQPASCVPTPA
jgi:hypothetical protein